MKRVLKSNFIKRLAVAIVVIISFFAAILLCPLFGTLQNVFAYTSSNLPSDEEIIENIFDETRGKFLEKNLNALAQMAKYEDFDSMIKDIENGGANKTAADFQHTTVKFGKSYGGNGDGAEELVWIPAYLSQSSVDNDGDGKGDAILTLWLAAASQTTWQFNPQHNFNSATKPSSNNYSTSLVRTEALNNTGVHYDGYGNATTDRTESLTPVEYKATTENTHEFQMYTTGSLSSYVVAPADVAWQTGEGSNRLKNDPGWEGESLGYYFQDIDGNEQTWINDNLWLPSTYEVYDGAITTNYMSVNFYARDVFGESNTNAAGLWGTNRSERSCQVSTYTVLRTGSVTTDASRHRGCHYLTSNNDGMTGGTYVTQKAGLRPALHLNLKSAAAAAVPEHEHDFGEWKITPATCMQAGKKERVCSAADCPLTDGKEIEEIDIDPTAHNLAHYDSVEATCSQTGNIEYWQCSVCEKYFSDSKGNTEITEEETEIAVNDTHTFADDWTYDETNHWHASTCGHEVTDGLAEHSWNDGEITKAATCTEEGERTYTCTVCKKTKTESIAATGHKFSAEWESDGTNHWHICTNECEETSDSAAHEWGEPTVTKEPTEDNEGEQTVKCAVCDYAKTETLSALGHTHKFADDWSYDETNHWHASTCGHEVTDGLAEHSWNDGEITKAATCTQAGEKIFTCTVCNATKTESLNKLDHDTVSHGAKEASCTEIGWNAYETCKNCDYTTYEEIPATGHTEVVDEAVAPTCTEAGKTEGKHCSVCGTVIEAQEEISALGHSHEWQITKQPTEDETGLKQNICTRCGDIDGEEVIAKLVSDENGGVIDLEPDKEYDLEIAVKESDVTYNLAGINKGYKVELFVVDGENRAPYDDSKTVTLMLVIPDGMEDNFTLYRRYGDILEPIDEESYKVDGRTLTIRTTLSAEFVFNAPALSQSEAGIPWWVWLIVVTSVIIIIILIVVICMVVKHKQSGGDNLTRVAVQGTAYDDAELKARLNAQDKKLDEIKDIVDGGFNDSYDGNDI